jgi:hypothetical protein
MRNMKEIKSLLLFKFNTEKYLLYSKMFHLEGRKEVTEILNQQKERQKQEEVNEENEKYTR